MSANFIYSKIAILLNKSQFPSSYAQNDATQCANNHYHTNSLIFQNIKNMR